MNKDYKDGTRIDFAVKGRADVLLPKLQLMIDTINNLHQLGNLDEFLVLFDSRYDAQATFIDWGKEENDG